MGKSPANQERRPRRRRWPDPSEGPFTIELTYAQQGGRTRCVGLQLTAVASGAEITTEVLRKISLADLMELDLAKQLRKIEEVLAKWGSQAPAFQSERWRQKAAELQSATQNPTRRGRPPLPDDHYETVAAFYSLACQAPGVRNPTGRVAEKWHVSPAAAAKWVRTARQKGYLPPTTRGKAAGTEEGLQNS